MKTSELPRAHLSHHAHGRTRIRIPSKKGDTKYFDGLGELISTWEAIETFEINPVLGTLLLLHEVDLPQIFDFFGKHQHFDLHAPHSGPQEPLSRKLGQSLEDLDSRLKDSTGGTADLASVTFLGLVTLGTFQLLRGQALSPATTLFQMAVSTLQGSRQKAKSPTHRNGS